MPEGMAVHDVWVEVDLGALKHNLAQVRSILPDGVRIMAVVKGNGFGHGYVEPSRAFVEAGADALAVTRIEEALPIRAAGITAPILLFAPIQPENAATAVEHRLDVTITSVPLLRALSEAAVGLGTSARVHIKVDTGMGRLGLSPEDVPSVVQAATDLPGIEIAGVYTHFATAAEADALPSFRQLDTFTRVVSGLREMRFQIGLVHAANSAAILRIPAAHLDMVRPGTLLYGQYPSAHVPRRLDLKPTWRLKARVCEVKDLPIGSSVGYGGEYVTARPTRIAIVPVGYADGFTLVPEGPVYRQGLLRFAARRFRRSLELEIKGLKVPVVGRVAMQMTAIDVTRVGEVRVGDEVTIPALRVPTNALIPRVYVDSAS